MDLRWILFGFICLVTGVTLNLLWYLDITLLYAIIPPVSILVIIYVILPLIFRCNKAVQRHFVYQHNSQRLPSNADLSDPSRFGMAGCRHFFLTVRENHFIGVWHTVPHNLIRYTHDKKPGDAFWTNALKASDRHIILYFHGNTGTRALEHRKELYWLLQNHGYHTIAFDYRGFADSSPVEISEETTVEDGTQVYAWLANLLSGGNESGRHRIVVWGHSLGTAIASSTIARLTNVNQTPAAMILESPFTNIGEAMLHHRKAKLYKCLPHFHWLFTKALNNSDIFYKTDFNIIAFHKVPVLILHACDDETVPINLGLKLTEIGNQGRNNLNEAEGSMPICWIDFGPGLGHKYICRAPELLPVLNNFLATTTSLHLVQ